MTTIEADVFNTPILNDMGEEITYVGQDKVKVDGKDTFVKVTRKGTLESFIKLALYKNTDEYMGEEERLRRYEIAESMRLREWSKLEENDTDMLIDLVLEATDVCASAQVTPMIRKYLIKK